MPQPTREQKITIGMYVALLTLIVLGIWIYFIKYEVRALPAKKDQQDSSFGQLRNSLIQFVDESKKNFNQVASQINDLMDSKATSTEDMVQLFTKKAEEKLREKRMANWSSFSNSDFSLRYPDGWMIKSLKNGEAGSGEIEIVSSSTAKVNNKVLADGRIIFELKDNKNASSTEEWLRTVNSSLDKTCRISTPTPAAVDQKNGLRELISSCKQPSDFNQELYVVPAGEKVMLEIKIEVAKKMNEAYQIIFSDIIKKFSFNK
jgi:hypothetical protein